jgi:hypothetical protein
MALQSARFRGKPRFDKIFVGDVTAYLRVNDQGDEVSAVQQALIDLHPRYSIPAGATGFFGQQTADAVVLFKTDHSLYPNDAVVGQKTITKLDGYFALPFSDREEWRSWKQRRLPQWNFTRRNELDRVNAGTPFTWNPLSSWIPIVFKNGFVHGISQILDPKGSPTSAYAPSATWGVSPLDLYHCHLMIDGIDPSAGAPPPWDDFASRNKKLASTRDECRAKADAAAEWGTPEWVARYRDLLGQRSYNQRTADLLNLIVAASTATTTSRPVYLLWHSFEEKLWRPTGMVYTDPRRYWWCEVTPNLHDVIAAPVDVSSQLGYVSLLENLCFVVDQACVITAIAGVQMEEIATLVNLDLKDWNAAKDNLPYP